MSNEKRLKPDDRPEAAGDILTELAKGIRVKPDEEIDRLERDERQNDVAVVLARIPEAFQEATPRELLERIAEPRFAAAARTWEPADGGLVLLGPTRAGKSTAAAFAFRRLAARGVTEGGRAWAFARRLRWFSAMELERARREHPLGHGDAPELVVASRAPLVVIDDVGWDRDPAAVSAVLAARYDRALPTVISSGMTAEALSAHYGPAVVRRIAESGGKRGRVIDAHPRRAA